jgi:hypothetical protein
MEPSTAVLTRLREITMAFAARHGDPHPTRLRMVETTQPACDALSGHCTNQPSIPIYLVVANGHFISSGRARTVRRRPTGRRSTCGSIVATATSAVSGGASAL